MLTVKTKVCDGCNAKGVTAEVCGAEFCESCIAQVKCREVLLGDSIKSFVVDSVQAWNKNSPMPAVPKVP